MSIAYRKQRGVALIMAILIVALATILAANVGFNAFLDLRRNATRYAMDQSFQVALGAEAWAADTLRRDGVSGSKQDDLTEEWATPIPPMPVEGGEVSGYLEDMQGRFNLNNLVMRNDKGQLVPNPTAVEQFERLLELLELEPKWAAMIADWIDSDGQESSPNGAEDATYTSQTPPYRTAEAPITRASELLALHEFGLERYRRLEPFVTALPVGTRLNLCTAPPEVLDALVPGLREFTLARKNVAETRKERCFPTVQDLESRLDSDQRQQLRASETLGERSAYFRATVWVTIGTTQFTLYSLLYRNDRTQLVRPILRSFGTA
jgi:general secretion pathway protein K